MTKKRKKITVKIGEKFGRLVVIGPPISKKVGNNKRPVVQTKCDCGTIKDIPCSHLVRGTTNSCGCYRSELKRKGTFAIDGRKKCSQCLKIKDTNQFTLANNTKDKLSCSCKECDRETGLKRKYKINSDDYNKLLKIQNNRCACCKTTRPHNGHKRKSFFCIDHDHDTGEVRGLLCVRCNTSLGKMGDSLKKIEDNIKMFIQYLKSPPSNSMESTKELE